MLLSTFRHASALDLGLLKSSKMVRTRKLSSSATSFDGPMAKRYLKFFVQAEPVWHHTVDVVKGVVPKVSSMSILDIASGPGEPGCSLAQAFPHSKVHITDSAGAMIDLAKRRVRDMGLEKQVNCSVMDMLDMSAFSPCSQDIVVANFALMFTPDFAKTLEQIHTVLRPGGFLIGTVWQDLQLLPIIKETMTTVLGHEPPPPPINPLSLKDPSIIQTGLLQSGLVQGPRHEETGILDFEIGPLDDEEALMTCLIPVTPILNDLEQAGKHGDVWATARNAVRDAA
mmetsp:Transcript_11450/g.14923  ORF Transcript_11450/g.14923 Transcript_11450/m.14923 type:complete len:284 (+) Transcript_11450:61-912(+)